LTGYSGDISRFRVVDFASTQTSLEDTLCSACPLPHSVVKALNHNPPEYYYGVGFYMCLTNKYTLIRKILLAIKAVIKLSLVFLIC